MQLIMLRRRDGAEELTHDVGATVVRSAPSGGVVLEMGPADGAPHLRLTFTAEETSRIIAAFRAVTGNGREEIVFPDD